MDRNNTNNINQEELEEALSFCDLSLENDQDLDDTSHHSPNSPSYDHDIFEFPFIPKTPLNNNKENFVVFCGKLIKDQGFVDGDGDQSRYLFRLSSTKQFNNNKNDLGSFYLLNSKANSSLSTKGFRSQSYSSFGKHKVLIGISKIEPKVELNEMKKRQSRRNHPLPMFPPVATDDIAMEDVGNGRTVDGKRGHRWSWLKHLKCRPNLFSVLAKTSLGCISRV
ncbi:hypothetical protein ES319_D13G026600v1 [Gossypium barbadense]|uniref:Uncharacterized protein n=1 Tax=Gossypium barbadense TaxID=3634 RepID=A0A5J5NHD4_GOSBA|nr:hypothetical protein ES319_D13G026600v1 [Gossypium barbadense]PPD68989.1 hypothetical protein GOBAR_DD34135 [Gossypium barbadense]